MNNSVFIGTELPQVTELKARLATVEAERDAARAASEKDREWVGRALEKQAEYLGQSQMLAAERDAARAGEARAVEALRAVVAGAYPHEVEIWTMEGAVLRHVHRVLDQHEPTLDNQPPTQQRAEVAAEALEKLAADLRQDPWGTTLHDVDSLRSILGARAAALRAGEVGDE